MILGWKDLFGAKFVFFIMMAPLTYWIPKEDAIRIKSELEQNENIVAVQFDYLFPPDDNIT